MLFLHSHGISTNLAVKIYKTYGDAALPTVQENPYQLARDIYGVGFKTADKIAQDLGLPHDHPSRVEAGIIYALNQMSNEGHVYAPQDELTHQAVELLEVTADLILPALDRLSSGRPRASGYFTPNPYIPFPPIGEALVSKGIAEFQNGDNGKPVIYLTPFYFSEKGVAERLSALNANSSQKGRHLHLPLPDNSLSSEQQTAIQTALTHPVSVLTGGPGTGKTTCLKALIAAIKIPEETLRPGLSHGASRQAPLRSH